MESRQLNQRAYLWLKQEGEGCDYTIGCGERLIPLKHSGSSIEKEIDTILKKYASNNELELTEIRILFENDPSLSPLYAKYKTFQLKRNRSKQLSELRDEAEFIQKRLKEIEKQVSEMT